MKGRNPKRKEKIIIKKNRLNPDNWLVIKKLSSEEKKEILNRFIEFYKGEKYENTCHKPRLDID